MSNKLRRLCHQPLCIPHDKGAERPGWSHISIGKVSGAESFRGRSLIAEKLVDSLQVADTW
jgi:hypothetical protein